jgi:hypothetical protein
MFLLQNENQSSGMVYDRHILRITEIILINVNIHILVYPILACIYSKLIFYYLSRPMTRQELSEMDRDDLTFYNCFLGMKEQPRIHYQVEDPAD